MDDEYLICKDVDFYMFNNIFDIDTIVNLARTCKSFLRIILSKEILPKLVFLCLKKSEDEVLKYRPYLGIRRNMEELKNDSNIFDELVKNASLPKFFYASIPSYLTPVRFKIPEIKISYDDCFLTGGKVCQSIYQKEWDGDVDVWVKGENHWEDYENNHLDVVFKNFEPFRCISGFDLSICMQGVEIKNGNLTNHVTPLGLFTYYTKKIIATLSSKTIEYYPSKYYDYHSNSFVCYLIHKRFSTIDVNHNNPNLSKNHNGNFSSCQHCRETIYYDKMITWLNRLQKYQDRFPDYEILFVPA